MIYENTPTLETQRLILRKATIEDLQNYFSIMSDEVANEFLPWFTVKTLDEAKTLLHKNFLDIYKKESGYRYAICLKTNNKMIGYCGMSGESNNDVGYGLRTEFWHNGFITEAVKAFVKRIKKAGYPYITATHDIKNPRSGEVMKKLGMRYMYTYIEQWQPKNIEVTFRMYQLNFDKSDSAYMEYWNKYENHFIEDLS